MTARKRTTAKDKQAAEKATPSAAEPTPAVKTAEAMAPDIEPAPTPETAEAAPAGAEPATDAHATEASPEAPTEIQGNEITGDGTGNALPPIDAEELPGLFVRTKRRIKSRRRAGYRFNREGTGIALELLTDEQIQQLRNDPALEVEECTFPIAAATDAPEA